MNISLCLPSEAQLPFAVFAFPVAWLQQPGAQLQERGLAPTSTTSRGRRSIVAEISGGPEMTPRGYHKNQTRPPFGPSKTARLRPLRRSDSTATVPSVSPGAQTLASGAILMAPFSWTSHMFMVAAQLP